MNCEIVFVDEDTNKRIKCGHPFLTIQHKTICAGAPKLFRENTPGASRLCQRCRLYHKPRIVLLVILLKHKQEQESFK
jgi:hypothetical protein